MYDDLNNFHVKEEAHSVSLQKVEIFFAHICVVPDFASTSRNSCTCGGHCCRICHRSGKLIMRFCLPCNAKVQCSLFVRLCRWVVKTIDALPYGDVLMI